MSVNDKMTAIADAIRAKTGGTDALSLDQMAMEIAGIQAAPVLQERTITENGTYTPDEGVDGFSKVTVNVTKTEVIVDWATELPDGDGYIYIALKPCDAERAIVLESVSEMEYGTVKDKVFSTEQVLNYNGQAAVPAHIEPKVLRIMSDSDYQRYYVIPDAFYIKDNKSTRIVGGGVTIQSSPTNADVHEFTAGFSGLSNVSYAFYKAGASKMILGDFANYDTGNTTSWFADTTAKSVSLKNAKISSIDTLSGGCAEEYNIPGWTYNNAAANGLFSDMRCLKKLDVSNWNVDVITNMNGFFNYDYALRTIDMTGWNMSAVTQMNTSFTQLYSLENIVLLDAVLPGLDLSFAQSARLSDESLVQISNALIADAEKTLTLHAIPKARCNEINGTVSTVTDGDSTYDFFAMSETGTVTLTEFITTVKGWTLA